MVSKRKRATGYLNGYETAQLRHCGVSVRKTGLQFSREIGEAELWTVWRAVSAIKRRSPRSDGWANWLIGAWANQADSRLGQGWAERIIKEEDHAYQYTQHLLRLSGATLTALQWTELAIGICCCLLESEQARVTATDVLSPEAMKRKRMLGQLNRLLKDRKLFVKGFEERMDRFVRNRNRFAHQLWVENVSGDPSDHATRLKMLNGIESFMLGLLTEAYRISSVFNGLFAAIGVTIAERDKVGNLDSWLGDWKDDIGKFVEVHRKV